MKLFLPLSFLFLCTVGSAQTKGVQSFSVELGKNGLLVNVIYDYQFSKSQFGFRGGLGFLPGRYVQAASITAGAYKLLGRENKFFELGIDIQYLSVNEGSDD